MKTTQYNLIQLIGLFATVVFMICYLFPLQMGKVKASPERMVPFLAHNEVALNGVATVTSIPITLIPMKNFGCMVKCTGSSPNVTVSYVVSMDYDYPGMTTYAAPERSVNIFGLLPDGSNSSITDTNYHYESYSPPPVFYHAIVITGNAGNGADTIVTVKLALQ